MRRPASGSSPDRVSTAPSIDPRCTVVYLVRHGRTELNAAGVLRGLLDPPLDHVGRAEADALRSMFAACPIDVVVTSPLRRALDTATAIADGCGAEVEVDDRFVDRDYGSVAGRARADVEAQYGAVERAPGVEPIRVVSARARAALEAIAAGITHGRAVVVAHDAINGTLLNRFLAYEQGRQISQRTGCWNRLESPDEGVHWCVTVIDAVPGDGRAP